MKKKVVKKLTKKELVNKMGGAKTAPTSKPKSDGFTICYSNCLMADKRS